MRAVRFNPAVLLYALVAGDCDFAIDVFVTRELADQARAEVLADEPTFVDLLAVEPLDDARPDPVFN